MPKLIDIPDDYGFMALFVGHSGDGKSCAAASWPKPRFHEFDGRYQGIQPTRKWFSDAQYRSIDIEHYNVQKTINDVEKKMDMDTSLAQMKQNGFETLCVDSLTTMNKLFLYKGMDMLVEGSGARFVKGDTKKGDMTELRMAGPGDYGIESKACNDVIMSLKTVTNINRICMAHTIPRYKKSDPSNAYSESVPDGEMLSLRPKIGEEILIHFNHVFKFSRREVGGGKVHFFVKFRDELARTSFDFLPNGEVDITGVSLYDYINKEREKANGVKA